MYRLENEFLSVTLDAGTGGISSIYDKRVQHEYLCCPDRALLFRLMIPDGENQFRHLDGTAPGIIIAGTTATLSYDLDRVRATATLALHGDSLSADLEIENGGPDVIEEVMFPWIRGIAPIDGGELIWPYFWRRRIEDVFGKDMGGDHHTWNEHTQKLAARYPAHLAAAWCDYGNREHGLSVQGRHKDFSIMDFFVHKVVEKDKDPVKRSLDFCTVHPRRVKPGERYQASPTVVLAHQGDWHAAAASHRDWLSTWIAKPQRPAKFAESIGWHFYFMKHQDGHEPWTYADLPEMARASLEAGCPYLLLFGWQTGGHDNAYFYRYVPNEDWGGQAALRKALDECRAMGVEAMPFFNGTLANTEMPEHKEFGHRWEAKTRTGHPYYAGDWARHNADAPSRNRSMLHTEIAFCKEQQEYFIATIARMINEYGFGNLQLDQISEKMLVDYSADHIVTTPDRVFVDGLRRILADVRAIVRKANPEGVMISEALNDFTGQWCDSSWDWNILLPFPEPILYTLPWLMASHEIDALEYGEANQAFAYKMHFDMKIDGGDAAITKYPRFAEHVRSLAELRHRAADCYVHADFRDQEGVHSEEHDGILIKVYENPAKRMLGIVVAETAGRGKEVSIAIDGNLTPHSATVDSNLRPAEPLPLAPVFVLDLDLYEVRIVRLELA